MTYCSNILESERRYLDLYSRIYSKVKWTIFEGYIYLWKWTFICNPRLKRRCVCCKGILQNGGLLYCPTYDIKGAGRCCRERRKFEGYIFVCKYDNKMGLSFSTSRVLHFLINILGRESTTPKLLITVTFFEIRAFFRVTTLFENRH